MDLVEFLRARLDDDEERARFVHEQADRPELEPWRLSWHDEYDLLCIEPSRGLAEVDAKRRIVARHHDFQGWCSGCGGDLEHHINDCPDLRDLASVYSDHPDYRQEWRP